MSRSTGNFDRLAPFYDLCASMVFGRKLVTAQLDLVDQLDDPSHILVLGGGTGQVLDRLTFLYPKAAIHYLEASSQMISRARKRLKGSVSRIHFEQGTESVLRGRPETYDALMTPFVLDVYPERHLSQAMNELYSVLKPGGRWLHTDFYLAEKCAWWHPYLISLMYMFFRLTTGIPARRLQPTDPIFQRLNLVEKSRSVFFQGLVRTQLFVKRSDCGAQPLEPVKQHLPNKVGQNNHNTY